MYALYNILLSILLLLTAPYIALRRVLQGEEWGFRLGHIPRLNREEPLWLHGASVGEIGALTPLVSKLREVFPGTPLVVSAMTKTGRERAIRDLEAVDLTIMSPFDYPPFVKRALRTLKPKALIIAETELWPNLVREAKKGGARVIMVNGRMSERSFRVYRSFRGFFRTVINSFDILCVQSEGDRQKLLRLGAHPDIVRITGSLKFDSSAHRLSIPKGELGMPDAVPILIAGSTRPGEEEIVFRAFKEVEESFPDLRLIVAPRHLRRSREVERLASTFNLSLRRRSDKSSCGPEKILLLDTLGELPQVYSAGTIAFVGGTLLPYGGHNLLEPAFHRLPVIFGPYTESVREVASRLRETGGGVEVRDYRDLARAILSLLGDAAERRRRGEAALQVARERSGGTDRTVTLLRSLGFI